MTPFKKTIVVLIAIFIFVYLYSKYYCEYLDNENSINMGNVNVLDIFKDMKTEQMVLFLQSKKIEPENLAKFLQQLKISSSQLMKEENIPKIMSLLYTNKMIVI